MVMEIVLKIERLVENGMKNRNISFKMGLILKPYLKRYKRCFNLQREIIKQHLAQEKKTEKQTSTTS